MESLLSDMSYINKIRAGMLNVNPKMDTFKNIAMMVEKKVAPLAEELKRQIEFDIPSGLPLLTTDGELLSHAMFKLIENGLRYSAEGKGKVTVRGAGDGGTLVVTIRDNGIGMTPEEVGKLGTIFFRSDNDTVRSYKGSGLGVPIAYGIIEGLDGTIGVESEPDKGTTFTIKLKGMT
jgi:signal transduction histidine kinase